MVATREGVLQIHLTPFTRGPFGGIKLSETRQIDDKFGLYLEPVINVWRKQGIDTDPDGKAKRRTWSPTALGCLLLRWSETFCRMLQAEYSP